MIGFIQKKKKKKKKDFTFVKRGKGRTSSELL